MYKLLFILGATFAPFAYANDRAVPDFCLAPNIEEFILSGATPMDKAEFERSDLTTFLEIEGLFKMLVDVLDSGDWMSLQYRPPTNPGGVTIQIQNYKAWVKMANFDEVEEWGLETDHSRFLAGFVCKASRLTGS